MKSTNVVFPVKNVVEIREEEIARSEGNKVLIRADKSLISTGTETFCLAGKFDAGSNWEAWCQFPFYPGYSMVATVVEVPEGVTGAKVGDRVFCDMQHKQYGWIDPNDPNVVFIPDYISSEEATYISLAMTTQLAVRRAELTLGETVGVVGCGLLGQLVTKYLRVSGCRKIICMDISPERLERAKINGATHIICKDAASAVEDIREITEGKMLDCVFDVTGYAPVLAQALLTLRTRGRLILLGDCPTPTLQHLAPGVVSNSLSILGIHASCYPNDSTALTPWSYREMSALLFDFIHDGRMSVKDLTSSLVSPLDAPQVYEKLVTKRTDVMGLIFDWDAVNKR